VGLPEVVIGGLYGRDELELDTARFVGRAFSLVESDIAGQPPLSRERNFLR
jgi:hypothetical protein